VVTFSDRAQRVGWGAAADVVLVADGGSVTRADAREPTELACVDRSRRDVALRAVAGQPLPGGDAALACDRAALGAAAQLCGLAAHLVDVTVEYVSARRQFGAPVGSYQAVKHHLADALLQLEHARPAVYRAAHTVATGGPHRTRDVSMAKAMAGAAGSLAARVALQCHGAIGYTWEHDLHLWLKRVWVLDRAYGDRDTHRSRVADAVL
jgi:alkylation response protein AidB-like acyl-CoA dehydrogenase